MHYGLIVHNQKARGPISQNRSSGRFPSMQYNHAKLTENYDTTSNQPNYMENSLASLSLCMEVVGT